VAPETKHKKAKIKNHTETTIEENRRYLILHKNSILSFEVASKMMNQSRRANPTN
jgi:hypothetical protein